MKQMTLNKIEGFGLIVILLSSFIQLLEGGISNSKQELDYYKLHYKLDRLWSLTSKQYADNHPQDSVHFSINFKGFVDDWKIYSQEREESLYLNKLIDDHIYWRVLAFIIGSLMLIVPKFIKAYHGNENIVLPSNRSLKRMSSNPRAIIYRRHSKRN